MLPESPALKDLYTAGRRQALRQSPLFSSAIGDEVLRALEAEVEPVALRSGEAVVRENEPSDSLSVVVSGRLRYACEVLGAEPPAELLPGSGAA